MELKEVLDKLGKSDVYKEWHTANDDFYLAHAFILFDEQNKDMWQIGFYSDEKDKIVTFQIEGDNITKTMESDVFKKPEEKVLELNTDNVKISLNEAIEIAKGCKEINYPNEPVMKYFLIIQNLKEGQVYNVTFATQTMKAINIKVSTDEGNIVDHKSHSLMDMRMQ